MMNKNSPRELEDRLIDFAVSIIGVAEALPNTRAGNHVAGQLIRSGTSPAPNYGEARSAESKRDFIHKMKISLKELRETMIWLKIVSRKSMVAGEIVDVAISACDELIAIFVSSTKTADRGFAQKVTSKSAVNHRHSPIKPQPSIGSSTAPIPLPPFLCHPAFLLQKPCDGPRQQLLGAAIAGWFSVRPSGRQ